MKEQQQKQPEWLLEFYDMCNVGPNIKAVGIPTSMLMKIQRALQESYGSLKCENNKGPHDNCSVYHQCYKKYLEKLG